MKTSLNDIHQTEQYLSGSLDTPDALVFEARLITHAGLRLNVHIQKKLMLVLKCFHRKRIKQKAELASIHIFNDPASRDFQDKISQIFKQ